MNMNRNLSLEQHILAEIEELERRMAELELEKVGLQRVLMRLKKENVSSHEVGRRNSIDRVLVEARLLEQLRHEKTALSSSRLYEIAKGVHPDLKESTFRSHLHRMKMKNMIRNVGSRRGVWVAFDADR